MKVIGTIGHVSHGIAQTIKSHFPAEEPVLIITNPHKKQETMELFPNYPEIFRPALRTLMHTTGTPRKKHVNKLHCSRKAKKKHRRNAKNR